MIARAELERDLVIVACAISAGIHGALTPEHLRESTAAGGGFAFSVVALLGVVVALTRRPGVAASAAATAVLGGLLAGYGLAVTTGVPLLHPEVEAIDGLALFTKAVEVVGLLAAAHLVAEARTTMRPIPLGLTTLIGWFSALAALAVAHGHHHV